MHKPLTEAEFWARVDRVPEGCWTWRRMVVGQRYGRVDWQGRFQLAHRVAWTLTNGPIPAGLEVCHRCDNHQCVRPDHLFLATHRENMLDAARKGRIHRALKLTDDQVREIRSRYLAGDTTVRIGHDFGINSGYVSRIGRGLKRAEVAA